MSMGSSIITHRVENCNNTTSLKGAEMRDGVLPSIHHFEQAMYNSRTTFFALVALIKPLSTWKS